MVPDLMSSDESVLHTSEDEDSSSDSDERPHRKVLKLLRHPLPFRTAEFQDRIKSLDRKIERKRDERARRMVLPVEEGELSKRTPPRGHPEWAIDYNRL